MNQSLSHDIVDKYVGDLGADVRNITAMLDWCQRNPELYPAVEEGFMQVVAKVNELLLQEDPKFPQINSLNTYLQSTPIPNIDDIVAGRSKLNIFSFGQAIVDMRNEMIEGERIADGGERTTNLFLKFHTIEKGHLARLCGAFFHFYDTLLRRQFPGVPRELICDALLEALVALGPEDNIIYDELTNPRKLNWVLTGTGIFSDELLADARRDFPFES
ncbi:MAG: hypothetical protein ABI721_05850 [Candidatus Dojkabacteria bacterium]